MDTDKPDRKPHHFCSDAVVFLLTVTVCFLLLSAACGYGTPMRIITQPIPELAMPQPPGPLELVPGPDPQPWQAGTVPVVPPIRVCWELPVLDGASNTMGTVAQQPAEPDETLPDDRAPFHGIIVQVADRYEVDPALVRAIILAESGYNPKARSKKGALGLMQLMPSTAKALGVQDIYDPEENIDGGVRYFRSLLDRFNGDVRLALAAYNAGSRHVRNYEGIPPFKATRHYIKKVLKFQEKFKMEKLRGGRRLA